MLSWRNGYESTQASSINSKFYTLAHERHSFLIFLYKFMRGKARICVATVAFGLGINKADIFAVVHMCLPQSLEHYLQEIGRAGRNGDLAYAVTLMVPGEEAIRHSLAHSDGITYIQGRTIVKFLEEYVDQALHDYDKARSETENLCDSHDICSVDIALPIGEIVQAADVKTETIETVISLLEEDRMGSILTYEGSICDDAMIILKRRDLSKLATTEPVARAIILCGKEMEKNDLPQSKEINNIGGTAIEKGFYAYSFGVWGFSIVRCASFLGKDAAPRHVFASLRRLQSMGEIEFLLDSNNNGKSLHLNVNKNGIAGLRTKLKESEQKSSFIEKLVTEIIKQSNSLEEIIVGKVEEIHSILHKVANLNYSECDKNQRLFRDLVTFHMKKDNFRAIVDCEDDTVPLIHEVLDDKGQRKLWIDACLLLRDPILLQKRASSAVKISTSSHLEVDYTSRCIAKILHGIESPRYRKSSGWNGLWGKWRTFRFSDLHAALVKRLKPFHENLG